MTHMLTRDKVFAWLVMFGVVLMLSCFMSSCSVSSRPSSEDPSSNYQELYQECLKADGTFWYKEHDVNVDFGCDR